MLAAFTVTQKITCNLFCCDDLNIRPETVIVKSQEIKKF